MAEIKPKRTRRRKLTPTEALDALKALVAENEALKEELEQIKEALRVSDDSLNAVIRERTALGQRCTTLTDDLTRIREQARRVKQWAGENARGNNVLIHAIDAVLFKPGYGEVHPFARWGHPPIR